MLTAHDREEYLFAALEAGAVGYLLKDTPAGEVVRALRSVAQGGSWLHPAMARKLVDTIARRRHAPTQETPAHLTGRELQVLALIARGPPTGKSPGSFT